MTLEGVQMLRGCWGFSFGPVVSETDTALLSKLVMLKFLNKNF